MSGQSDNKASRQLYSPTIVLLTINTYKEETNSIVTSLHTWCFDRIQHNIKILKTGTINTLYPTPYTLD